MSVLPGAPLDYRYALDAIMPAYIRAESVAVICNAPELEPELDLRGIRGGSASNPSLALWIEPMIDGWSEDLARLSESVPEGGSLLVIASRPLAFALPERRNWSGQPIGKRFTGINRLRGALRDRGFRIVNSYGIHGPVSIIDNAMGRLLAVAGRPDLSDRYHFSGRMRYCTQGPLDFMSAVALIEATRERAV